MHISDLLKNSPIRTFDASIGGALGKGNLGVIVAKKGIGKTACLVHLATDKMLQGENIVHVTFSNDVNDVSSWYKEIFKQVVNSSDIKDTLATYENMLSHRTIMNFPKDASLKTVLSSLDALIRNAIKADTVFFDSFALTLLSMDEVALIKKFAKDLNVETWFAVSPVRQEAVVDEYGVPNTIQPYEKDIDVLVGLKTDENSKKVKMTVIKTPHSNDRKIMSVMLNPATMLIEE